MLSNSSLFPALSDLQKISLWWLNLLADNGSYPSYAFILFLSSNKNMLTYLKEYGRDLDFISGRNCLVLVFNKNKFRRSGVDETLRQVKGNLNIPYWKGLVDEEIHQGYSIQIADYFEIPYTALPCMIIFQDIRSPEHLLIPFHGNEVDDIALEMKIIFSNVQKAISRKKSILRELQKYYQKEALKKGSQVLIYSIGTIIGKTYETAVETWFRTLCGR